MLHKIPCIERTKTKAGIAETSSQNTEAEKQDTLEEKIHN